jgi:TPR repeat protein
MQAHNPLLHDFRSFFNRVANEYCALSEALLPVEGLIDHLEQQVEKWLHQPKKDNTYAITVMRTLMEVSLPQGENYHHLNQLRARLIYITGRIHEMGFESFKQNSKQAKLNFVRAAELGDIKAWEALGKIYLRAALEMRTPIYKHAEFHEALSCFSNAGPKAAFNLITCFEVMYGHAKLEANFDAIFKALQWSLQLLSKHPLLVNEKLFLNPELLKTEILNMQLLQKAAEDAVKSSARVLEVDRLPVAEMEQRYIYVTQDFESTEGRNPIFDYYYAVILKQLMKQWPRESESDREKSAAMKLKVADLLLRIKDNHYPAFLRPLQQCALGIALYEHNIVEADELRAAKTAFKNSTRGGCAMANHFLASILLAEGNTTVANEMRMVGVRALDPAAMVSYFLQMSNKNIINRELDQASLEDIVNIVKNAEDALKTIEKMQQNPNVVKAILENIQDAKINITEVLLRATTLPDLFMPDKWTMHAPVANHIIELLMEYHKTDPENYNAKLHTLYRLQLACDVLSNEKVLEPSLISAMQEKIKIATFHVARNQYYHKLNALCHPDLNLPEGTSDKQRNIARAKSRLRAATDFMKHRGHLQLPYYLEHLDPLHRKPEFRQAWLHSPDNKDFFSWLASFESFKPDEFERILYLRPDEREHYRLALHNDAVCYAVSQQAPEPATYLFVLDLNNQLYIASEQREIAGNQLFHHSTFLAGEPVIAAGEVTIENNKITKLANYSGHYMPNANAILDAFNRLNEAGMLSEDVRFALIGVNVPTGMIIDVNNMTLVEFVNLIDCMKLIEQKSDLDSSNNHHVQLPNSKATKQIDGHQLGLAERFALNNLADEMDAFIAAKDSVIERKAAILQAQHNVGVFGMFTAGSIQHDNHKIRVTKETEMEWLELEKANQDDDYMGHFKKSK